MAQSNGTVAPTPGSAHHNDVAEIFACKGRGRAIPLSVPAIGGERLTRGVLEKARVLADVLGVARSAPVLAFSLGALGEDSVLVQSGTILRPELRDLVRAGTVGDILGQFIDHKGENRGCGSGRAHHWPVALRPQGPRPGGCHRRRTRQVRGGDGRAPRHLVNVLVTDEATASFALE